MERSKENEAEVVKEYKYKTEYQPGWEEARRRCLWMQEIAKKWKVMIACPSATDTTTEEEYTSM